MAGSVNKAILLGNLGKAPDVYHDRNGKPIVTLSIATSTSWTDKSSGERKERTHWHKAVIFKEQECKMAESLKKGSRVWIEGALRNRKFTDKAGIERYVTEVVIDNFGHNLKNMNASRGEGVGASSEDDYGYDDDQPDNAQLSVFDSDEDYIPMGG